MMRPPPPVEDYEEEAFASPAVERRGTFIMIAVIVIVAAAVFIWAGVAAFAHQAPTGWSYPWARCSSTDCKEVPDDWIEERADGNYRVVHTDELIPMRDKRVKDSPDGHTHWCAHQSGADAGCTICLFVPPKGF